MNVLTTRGALAKALTASLLREYGADEETWREDAERMADTLLASGAVIDAAALADDRALHQVVADAIYDHACDPTGYKAIAILRALTAVLSERGA